MRPRSLVIVYVTVFVDLLGFGIILPLLPYYAERYGATGLWIGAIGSAYSAAQFLGAQVLGRLSDRIGRRPVILASLVGSAASLAATGLATSLPLLFGARALAGLFGGSIAAAQAYIADVTTREERTRYMGLLGAAIGLGFIFGPAIGALLSRFGFGTAAFAAAGIAAANFLLGYVLLPESRTGTARPRTRLTVANLTGALRHPFVGRILLATFAGTLAFVSMEATFALLGQRRFNLDQRGLGFVFTYVGVLIAVVQGGLIGRLNARYGERALTIAGAALMAGSLALLPYAPGFAGTLVVLALLAAAQGMLVPALSSLLSQESDPDEQGGTLGLGQSVAAAARAVGPVAAGWLYDRGIAIPYLGAAALALAAAWLMTGVRVPGLGGGGE